MDKLLINWCRFFFHQQYVFWSRDTSKTWQKGDSEKMMIGYFRLMTINSLQNRCVEWFIVKDQAAKRKTQKLCYNQLPFQPSIFFRMSFFNLSPCKNTLPPLPGTTFRCLQSPLFLLAICTGLRRIVWYLERQGKRWRSATQTSKWRGGRVRESFHVRLVETSESNSMVVFWCRWSVDVFFF